MRKRPPNPMARGRPHKADFRFPLSFSYTKGARGRPSQIKLVVFALAMHWGSDRDRVRLQMLLNSRPGTKIITVSETGDTLGRRPHLDVDFSTDRGHRSIARRISEERQLFPGARILVVMDWYWLPVHYLGDRYGMLWIDTGVHRLLSGGADEVILPFDEGELHRGKSSCMYLMLDGKFHPDVNLEYVPLGHNPLWVASGEQEIEEVLAQFPGGTNQDNTRKWLSSETPFVSATLIPDMDPNGN